MSYTVEIWQSGMKVAAVFAETASEVLWAVAGYAAQYEQDGPVEIKVKNPRKPRAAIAKAEKEEA